MKFVLVDRISLLERGRRIVAHKALSLAEEYLADHFPAFPVLPGVLVMEAMLQASAWVVRDALDFAPAFVVLSEARNVTYKSFVAPGEVLTVESVCKELAGDRSVFAATGRVGDREIVKGRLALRHFSLAESEPELAEIDERNRTQQRDLFTRLAAGAALDTAVSG
ncbi:MAG: beta-hydroxyacyl-ACP dehydratase [Phycisphaerae bacterium]